VALLEVRNLTVAIKKNAKVLKAVDDISFSIDEGESLGLAGESGCGKSMTALAIPNLLPEAAEIIHGEIVYDNQLLTSFNQKELCRIRGKEISIIFQEYRQALNPLIKAGRQITETLNLRDNTDKKNNERRALEMLSQLGFDDPQKAYNAYPHQLSGGMCQRVMAAIAAISRPRLLLADEPSSALDMESQQRIISLLLEMNREYKTSVLIISHDLSIIRQFCSRYLIMYAGKIVEEGPAGELFSPLHPYTKALVGAIPVKDKRDQVLENIPGKVPSIEDNFTGCPFAPRCKHAQKVCTESFPPLVEVSDKQKVHCFFPQQQRGTND
jgi:peptide/nickel transport system ATP-binding protein